MGAVWSAWLGLVLASGELIVLALTNRAVLGVGGVVGSGLGGLAVTAVFAGLVGLIAGVVHGLWRGGLPHRVVALQVTLAGVAVMSLYLVPPALQMIDDGRAPAGYATFAILAGFFGALFVNVRYWLARLDRGLVPPAPWPAIALGAGMVSLVVATAIDATRDAGGRYALEGDPSVLLVTVDALRDDRVGATDPAGRAITPRLDAFAKGGVRFERAITQSTTSLSAHASLITGLHPLRHGALTSFDRVGPGLPDVARAYREEAFATAAFVTTLDLDGAGLDRGFALYDAGGPPLTPILDHFAAVRLLIAWASPAALSGRTDEQTVEAFLRWYRAAGDRPGFVWVHLGGLRPPWRLLPTPQITERDRAAAMEAYRERLRRTDALIGRILDEVDAVGAADRTLVVVAGTHGAMVGEHGLGPSPDGLYDELVRVPLIVRMPGVGRKGRTVGAQVRLMDVAPTMLAWADLPRDDRMEGIDLTGFFDGRREQSVWSSLLGHNRDGGWMIGVRQPDVKYIEDLSTGEAWLYALDRDPGEQTDLAPEQAQTVAQAAGMLGSERKALEARDDGGEADPLRRARLEALGYR